MFDRFLNTPLHFLQSSSKNPGRKIMEKSSTVAGKLNFGFDEHLTNILNDSGLF